MVDWLTLWQAPESSDSRQNCRQPEIVGERLPAKTPADTPHDEALVLPDFYVALG
jgi:hypothetical protein